MASYEPYVELNLEDLDQNTKYRFAEIELSYAFNTAVRLFRRDSNNFLKAEVFVQRMVDPNMSFEESGEFHDLINSPLFRKPGKIETIFYFRFNGVAYNKITKITGISPNTISKNKFYDYRERFPIWPRWTPERLSYWNMQKGMLNIYNQPLHHYNPEE